MSTLAQFLKAKEPLFEHSLLQLEQRTGKKGIDAALTAEIATKAAQTMTALGLNASCTGPELYTALIEKIRQHDEHFARALGGDDPSDVARMIPLIVAAAKKVDMPRRGFFIKKEVAADMLTKNPPTAILERLGYHDVKTMLAHEDLHEIFLALRFGQDPDWLNQFDEGYKKLKVADFEQREIELVPFDHRKWGDIAAHFIEQKLHNITHSKEMGAIAILPLSIKKMRGISLKDFPLIMHYYNEIRLYSAFFKLMQTKRNFGEIVANTLIADPAHVKIIVNHNIHWRVIQRYFGKHPKGHPEIFEPHVQPEDLHWRKADHIMYEVDPELGFWRDLDYVAAMKDGEAVTFAIMDVSFSYSNGLPFRERYLYHFRESLWNEIFARYMGQKMLEEQVLVKLDNDLIKPEELVL